MATLRLRVLTLFASAMVWAAGSASADRPRPSSPVDHAARLQSWQDHQRLEDDSLFRGLAWRSIGPVVQGGRVVDIETVPGEPYTFYVAYASGGLWRTRNNGVTFEPLFDDQPTMIMGDVAVDPSAPSTVWVGTGENNSSRSSYGGMGVFRSGDGGGSWEHKGLGDTDRIGRILVDPRDSNRVYVAALGKLYTSGGERGVYRTTDGGTSWARVLAVGDAEDAEDGEMTGVVDLVMDPSNSNMLYAATWERSRRPWDFVESGAGSGIWKSTDGGDSWQRLEGGFPRGAQVGRIGLTIAASNPKTLYAALDNQEELPAEEWDLGDGAITAKRLRTMSKEEFLEQDPEEIEDFVRGSDLDTSIDAKKLIELVESGELTIEEILAELEDANANLFDTDIRGIEVWRSDDAGASWRLTHEEPIRRMVYTYGYYFGQIRVSPTDPEQIYILGVPLIASSDGGATFYTLQDPEVHVDYHAMWIDPNHSDRLFIGNDGGIDISYDGGTSWLKLDAQPVGQFYSITLDSIDTIGPYTVYGGLQDNGTYKGSSTTRWQQGERWQRVGGGDGMYVQIDSRDNATVYSGFQFGYYNRRGPGSKPTSVRPRDTLGEPALRYNWQTPIELSTHNQDILYYGANRTYRSLDQGETWQAISADLSRSEMRGDVPFGTIATLAESELRFGLLWAGTDDGFVHVSEDGGVEWADVSDGLPADRWISRVEPSRHEEKVAYVSLNGYRDDDIAAYLYRTADLGATWTSISAGLPAEAINVVREDPVNPAVLYVGSDRGVYVSLDTGSSWQGLGMNLPKVPVHDLAVHPSQRELVAGTHGRSVWVLDALPIQDLDATLRDTPVHLFPLEAIQFERDWKERRSEWFYRPERAPEMALTWWSKEDAGDTTLEILDSDDRVLRSWSTEVERGVGSIAWDLLLDEDAALAAERARETAGEDKPITKRKKKAKAKAAQDDLESTKGKRARSPWAEAVRLGRPLYITPGSYALRMTIGEHSAEVEFEVETPEPRDPRAKEAPKIRGRKDE